MRQSKLPAHLITDQRIKRCSVCQQPFVGDTEESLSKAFANHVRTAHKPGQTNEDASQAAARIVREATENH